MPQKRAVEHRTTEMSPKATELEAAREILAEVFGIRLSAMDEMIENRFRAGEARRSMEDGLWPQELWVEVKG